jgi:hypothetical protein
MSEGSPGDRHMTAKASPRFSMLCQTCTRRRETTGYTCGIRSGAATRRADRHRSASYCTLFLRVRQAPPLDTHHNLQPDLPIIQMDDCGILFSGLLKSPHPVSIPSIEKLFSMFPSGIAGTGLLMLRICSAAVLLWMVRRKLSNRNRPGSCFSSSRERLAWVCLHRSPQQRDARSSSLAFGMPMLGLHSTA